jgi:hypothetical protein
MCSLWDRAAYFELCDEKDEKKPRRKATTVAMTEGNFISPAPVGSAGCGRLVTSDQSMIMGVK